MSVLGPIRDLMQIETRHTMLPPPPGPQHPDWERSWRHLFETYVPAMRAYVRTVLRKTLKRPVSADDAEEVTQAYLVACVDKGWLSRDVGTIRSFRRYLKVQLFRFVHDWLDHQLAMKRKPAGVIDPALLEDLLEAPDDEALAALDKGFVDVACEQALSRLERTSADHATVIRDLLRTQGEGSGDLAAFLGRPARQLPVIRHRARRAFAALFLEELRGTTRDLASFESLLRGLEPYLV